MENSRVAGYINVMRRDEVIARLKATEPALRGFGVAALYLFGSHARGDARPDSDWDIAVFLKGGPSSEDQRILADIGFDLMMEHGDHIQVVPIDAARSVEHSSFLKNVYEDGIAA